MPTVPNKHPTIYSTKRIALVGEHATEEDATEGEPFSGLSGRFLNHLLSRAGIARDTCLLANVCQHQPPNGRIQAFAWDGPEIQQGLCQLKEDIAKFEPNVVVLLGNLPLKAAKDPQRIHPLNLNRYSFKNSVWRGSLFQAMAESPFSTIKCLSTLHPASCLRSYEETPLLQFDLKRATLESETTGLSLPSRVIATSLTLTETLFRLANIRELKVPVSLDIEGGVKGMSCISFATAPDRAFIVPFTRKDGSSYWTAEEECSIWPALTAVLEDPLVPKILQNSLYDRFVLQYAYGIVMRGVTDDTMLKHWEWYAELPKALGVQTSIYTREPYYKGDIKSQDDETFYRYCCMDSAVTTEINTAIDLAEPSLSHYRLNVGLLNPLLYMELRGIRYDVQGAKERREHLRIALFRAQARLNHLAGCVLDFSSLASLRATGSAFLCQKKNPQKPYAGNEDAWNRFNALLDHPTPDLATIGELEDLCGISMNVDGAMFKPYLYEDLGLPSQYNEDKTTKKKTLTADYEALLKLSKHATGQAVEIIKIAIEIRALDTRQRMLSIRADKDSRIRCGYNIVGSETGRITCYTSPTGSGYNLQTIPNYTNPADSPGGVLGDRDLFIADPDHWFFQCDLAGADGWTVAAYSAMLGDTTMMDDYNAGLKPAQVLAMKLLGFDVDFNDRQALLSAKKRISKDSWEYFACKRVQHGSSYGQGKITISRSILKDSEGKMFLPPAECEAIKNFFFARFWGVKRWHNWVQGKIRTKPELTAASGQVRRFLGRTDEIFTQAVAHEPQANTTYATNLAMHRLWTDKGNRFSTSNRLPGQTDQTVNMQSCSCKLRIEPLHQVHDALCGQFRKEDSAWAIARIKSYFDNPLMIAGQKIIVPFEGAYGPSWGNLTEGKI